MALVTTAASQSHSSKSDTLTAQADAILSRVAEVADRLEQCANALYGSVPEATAGEVKDRPVSTMDSRLRDIRAQVGRVETAAIRIQSGL